MTSPRHTHSNQPRSRLQFSITGPRGAWALVSGVVTWEDTTLHRAKIERSLNQQRAGRICHCHPGRLATVSDTPGGGTDQRGREREACHVGPLQKLIRPLQKLWAHGVLGFSEQGPSAVGKGQGSRTSCARCCLDVTPLGPRELASSQREFRL